MDSCSWLLGQADFDHMPKFCSHDRGDAAMVIT